MPLSNGRYRDAQAHPARASDPLRRGQKDNINGFAEHAHLWITTLITPGSDQQHSSPRIGNHCHPRFSAE